MITMSLPLFLIAGLVIFIVGMKFAKRANRQVIAFENQIRMDAVRAYVSTLTDQSDQISRLEKMVMWLPEKVVDHIEHKHKMKIKDREDALMFMAMGAPVKIEEL
ncbi:hypothetical protein [Agrobacterium rosae]|uniref:Uncharacterized protein n=1 Tax=Agrobacterium rosae TaxID=1972867 RepID=A0AAE5RYI8_9HYPH|nr:hypothetical protein [Agrobacterium rosae]KAA3511591.1 hypothetical protein DXM21_14185 [Agrobacterium rosae]KAA3518985.1 hypothetical protein DXM25_13830 [Agrobacterium rosae]MQB49287.1 hypothetical protein [Agrobacterium rosae]POO51807.1 hypothetical protein CPJ18_09975 [Agrobacterium rosae]